MVYACVVFENRDKILLDGSDPVKGKNLEDYHDEEEVFALKGIGESDSDAGSYDDSEDVDEGDEEDDEEPERTVRTKSSKKTKRRGQDDVPAEEESAASASDEDVEERWGKNKFSYYSATAQEVDSDDEEARELEEAEALRLQAKAREAITDDDFGLNDSRLFQTPTLDTCVLYPCSLSSCLTQSDWSDSASTQSNPGPSTTVPLVTAPRDKKSILCQLELSSPEVLALAREWGHVAAVMRKLEVAIAKCVLFRCFTFICRSDGLFPISWRIKANRADPEPSLSRDGALALPNFSYLCHRSFPLPLRPLYASPRPHP